MTLRIPSGTFKFIGAVKDEWQLYSDNAADYTLGRPIGYGASSIVYEAIYHNSSQEPIPCALKVLDLDSLPLNSLRLLERETQLMSLSKHPNVLRVRGTWMDGHKLYIALRLMRSGSVADVMRYGWPGGVEEEVARCILKQALEGLNYLHVNGFIHRDVKAANLLIDDDGTVLLGDLGVAASLHEEDSSSPKSTIVSNSTVPTRRPSSTKVQSGKRKSFVGTPCWMAPEVVSQKHYDSKADIWSLGITALELAEGRAPRSRDPPYKVLMKTIQDEPPTLDREGGQFKYSKAFKEIIESCLMKDPSKRPTAAELLQTSFFRNSKKPSYLVSTILNDLPPLVDRQERRRVPSALTRLSVESWDFTQGNATSPSNSLRLKGAAVESLFEMEELGEQINESREVVDQQHVTFVTRRSSSRYDLDESPSGDLTDDSASAPSTSPPSSSVADPIAIPISHSMKRPPALGESSPSSISGGSSSGSPGLWRKLTRKGLKMSFENDNRQQNSVVDGKRRGI